MQLFHALLSEVKFNIPVTSKIMKKMKNLRLVHSPAWAAIVKGLIRSQMSLHQVTYQGLSERLLQQFGSEQSAFNLKSKINKGVLGAQLFLQIMLVLKVENLDMKQILHLWQQHADK